MSSTRFFMRSEDVLNYALALGFLTLMGFLSYVCFYIVELLKSIKQTVDESNDIMSEITAAKESLKKGRVGKIVGKLLFK